MLADSGRKQTTLRRGFFFVDDDSWIFYPAIDEILERYKASKKAHGEAFPGDEDDDAL